MSAPPPQPAAIFDRVGGAFADRFEALSERYPVAGRRLLSVSIPRILPITSGLRLRVIDLDDQQCQLQLPFRAKSKNHVGGIYLGALTIAAEVSMAIYTMRICRPDKFSVLVKRSRSEFTRQARENVVAICAPAPKIKDAIFACRDLASKDKREITIDVDVDLQKAGEKMGGASFDVSIYRR